MVGIVADDITGANDIGLMFAKYGYRVEVFSQYNSIDLASIPADVLVLDTNSRCDDPELAYNKVAAATKLLAPLRPRLMIKKTCSVFRGNIGVEFDAMLDAVAADFAIVVAAFPKNGRITKEGLHFVHGRPLVESEFVNDPVHPTRCNDLREIITQQSQRRVNLLDHQVVAAGPTAIRAELERLRPLGGYLVCDVVDQTALQLLAEAFANEPLIFGSSAIAEELPCFWPPPTKGYSLSELPKTPAGTLIIAGSLTPQTKQQVELARESGVLTAELDTRLLFSELGRVQEMERLTGLAIPALRAGRTVLIHSAQEASLIDATLRVAADQGFNRIEANRKVSNTLGELTKTLVAATGIKRLILAGGETAGDVCRHLGISGNLVLSEIQPGLPSGLSRGQEELLLVLKSGSFGSPDFLLEAVQHLAEL